MDKKKKEQLLALLFNDKMDEGERDSAIDNLKAENSYLEAAFSQPSSDPQANNAEVVSKEEFDSPKLWTKKERETMEQLDASMDDLPPEEPEEEPFSKSIGKKYSKADRRKDRRRANAQLKSDYKNELSEAEVARLGVQAIQSEFPDAAPDEISRAFPLARTAIDGDPTQGVAQDRVRLSQSPDGAAVIGEAKAAQGGDRAETMGAMLSLILPVLVGAAVGGKRGALYAAEGAGKSRLDTFKNREKAEAEVAAAERKKIDAKEMIDYTNLEKQKLEIEKEDRAEDRKARSKEQEDFYSKIPAADKSALLNAEGTLARLTTLADEFEALGTNEFSMQAGSLVSGMPAYNPVASLKAMIPRIVRLNGDTGNIAIQERKITLDALLGNKTSNGVEAAERLRRMAQSLGEAAVTTFRNYETAERKGGREVMRDLAMSTLPSRAKALLAAWQELETPPSPALAREALKKAGFNISNDVLESIGF